MCNIYTHICLYKHIYLLFPESFFWFPDSRPWPSARALHKTQLSVRGVSYSPFPSSHSPKLMLTILNLHTYPKYLSLVFICQPRAVCLSFISLSMLRLLFIWSLLTRCFWRKWKGLGLEVCLLIFPLFCSQSRMHPLGKNMSDALATVSLSAKWLRSELPVLDPTGKSHQLGKASVGKPGKPKKDEWL